MILWQRYGGYEVSSMGDSRFSAFNAMMPDGRSIEHHYQCDVKGYDPGGKNWRAGKGKPPLRDVDLWVEYLWLWIKWARSHPDLIAELKEKVLQCNGVISDRFATTPVNQAHALAVILNGDEDAPR
jgi:hypothetical protein